MANTTWSAIKTIMHAQLRGVTPTSYANVTFYKDRGEGDFVEKAIEQAPTRAREYAIELEAPNGDVFFSDLNAKMEPLRCKVTIAYPSKWPENDRDMLDSILDEDRRAVDKVIGMDATAYTDSCMIEPEFEIDRSNDGVVFWF